MKQRERREERERGRETERKRETERCCATSVRKDNGANRLQKKKSLMTQKDSIYEQSRERGREREKEKERERVS